jgi:broad specificity phosphatase PhoE
MAPVAAPVYAWGMLRVLLLLLLFAVSPAWADPALWALLRDGGQIVLIRHAVTDPGVGDPPGFRLDDCRTQRNLSAAGVEEARRLGAAFRAQRVPVAQVLSSPWCRCLETARIAFGEARADPMLGNLFTHGENTARQQAQFRELAGKPAPGGNRIMVTHGATIAAFTGISPGTAEAIVGTFDRDGRFRVAGRIEVPQ